jgi:hypothetical protein
MQTNISSVPHCFSPDATVQAIQDLQGIQPISGLQHIVEFLILDCV